LQHHHRTTLCFILAGKRCWSEATVSHHVLHQYREEPATSVPWRTSSSNLIGSAAAAIALAT